MATTATAAGKKPRAAAPSKPAKAASVATQAGNAAAAAAAATGELTELVSVASQNTLAINPLLGLNRGDVANAAKSLLKVIGRAPGASASHFWRYVKQLAGVSKGRSEVQPDPQDRRFADPAWKSNALFTRLMQAHLMTQKELQAFIDGSKLDAIDKGRARFFASLLTDALAPSNFVFGNPAALRKVLDTGGDNLVKGFKNLVHDMRHNHMMELPAFHGHYSERKKESSYAQVKGAVPGAVSPANG